MDQPYHPVGGRRLPGAIRSVFLKEYKMARCRRFFPWGVWVFACLVCAPEASAGIFTHASAGTQENIFDSGNPAHYASDPELGFTIVSKAFASASVTVTESGTHKLSLHISAFTSMEGEPNPIGVAQAGAHWTEQFTVLLDMEVLADELDEYDVGDIYLIQYIAVNGYISETGDGVGILDLYTTDYAQIFSGSGAYPFSNPLSLTAAISAPRDPEQPDDYIYHMTAHFGATVTAMAGPENGSASADFGNTIRLGPILFKDAAGKIIPAHAISLISESGYIYEVVDVPPSTAVPEPSALVLLLLGVPFLCSKRSACAVAACRRERAVA